MTRRLFIVVLAWMAVAGAPVSVVAADAEAGRLKAGTCLGCHGIGSYTNVYPSYHVPKLAGQYAEYIVAALQAYQAGERGHRTMQAQAHKMSEQDMADVAAFFAAQPAQTPAAPAEPGTAAAPVPVALTQEQEQKLQVCVGCHGLDGNSPLPQNPRLAGQYRDYLRQALLDYRDGRRKNEIMLGMIGLLEERDIEVLANYFSKQQGLGIVAIGRTIGP